MSIQRPERSNALDQSTLRGGARIACMICQALYVPSHTHTYLLQAPQAVLESAFMSMCHFCFRCRRPACPGCWDDVHGVCGDCALETQLPFRSALAPLQGSLFTTTRRAQVARVLPLTTPLVCVRPGRFQRAPLPIDTASTVYLPTLGEAPGNGVASSTAHASASLPPDESDELDIATMATRPEAGDLPSSMDIDMIETQPEPRPREKHWLERVVTAILLLLFLAIVGLIAAASLSAQANAAIARLLHVDIRAEIMALWQLIRSIHF